MNIRWLSHAQAWIYYMMKTLFLWQLIFHVAAGSGCFPFVPFDSSFTWWWWIFRIYKSSWKPTQFSTLSCGNEGRVSLLWRRVDGLLEKGTDKAVKVIHSSSVWSPAQVMHDVDKFIKWNVILAFQFGFFFFFSTLKLLHLFFISWPKCCRYFRVNHREMWLNNM